MIVKPFNRSTLKRGDSYAEVYVLNNDLGHRTLRGEIAYVCESGYSFRVPGESRPRRSTWGRNPSIVKMAVGKSRGPRAKVLVGDSVQRIKYRGSQHLTELIDEIFDS